MKYLVEHNKCVRSEVTFERQKHLKNLKLYEVKVNGETAGHLREYKHLRKGLGKWNWRRFLGVRNHTLPIGSTFPLPKYIRYKKFLDLKKAVTYYLKRFEVVEHT